MHARWPPEQAHLHVQKRSQGDSTMGSKCLPKAQTRHADWIQLHLADEDHTSARTQPALKNSRFNKRMVLKVGLVYA
jgi:hypothetical protein